MIATAAINHPTLDWVQQIAGSPKIYLDLADPSANCVIPANAAAVATIQDKAGASWAQATGANQATFSVSGVGARSGLSFDGSNDNYQTTGVTTSAGDYTIFILHNPTTASGTNRWILDTNVGGTRLIIAHLTSTSGQTGFNDGSWHDFGAATTGAQIMRLTLNSGGNVSQLYRNGVQVGSNSTYSACAFGNQTGLGSDAGASLGFYQGVLSLVLVFPFLLGASDIAFAERKMGQLAGITVG